jgi:D-aspartate ligase
VSSVTPALPQATARSDGNEGRAHPDWPPAVIAGAWRTGMLGVRSLHRRGVDVCCFDTHRDLPGFKAAYGKAYVCPNPDTAPDAWVDFMIDLAGRLGRAPVLISSADQFVSSIAAHAHRLSAHYILSPGVQLQGQLATKQTQYELAAKHGMPMPRTQFVHSAAEVEEFARTAMFPCLLKPIHFREWQRLPETHPLSFQKIAIAETPAELVAHWRAASAVNPSVILQEIIEGPDDGKRVYVSCYDRDGRRIGDAMFRELRCDPLGFGPATVTEPVVDTETDAICDAFLRRIGYTGICEIEMKRDTRDGRVKLIEANPRLTGGGDAAPYAGVDVCWLHYLDMIGQPVTPVQPSGRDFRHVVLRSDIQAVVNYRRAGLITWRDVLHSYRRPLKFFDLDGDDWRYSLETVYRVMRSAIGIAIRSVFGESRKRRGHQ